MFDRVLRWMRDRARGRLYVVTVHACEKLEAHRLVSDDVEHVVLSGRIVEKQKDRHSGEPKYVVDGSSLDGQPMSVVAKMGPTGRLVIITVYLSTEEGGS